MDYPNVFFLISVLITLIAILSQLLKWVREINSGEPQKNNANCNVPVVVIHGLGGWKLETKLMMKYLSKSGFQKIFEFDYKEKCGQVPINEISKNLSIFIRKNILDKKLFIIGISQGGIVARHYIQNYNEKEVIKCITICSPHKGSWLAYISSRPGFIDLRPKSALLIMLQKNNDATPYFCIYTPFDFVVVPGWNACLNSAKKNKIVLSLLHPFAFWCHPSLKFILRCLTERNI